MEIPKLKIYGVLICIIIPYLVAKPVSLNDIIAAESKQKSKIATTQLPATLPDSLERISFNEVLNLKPPKTKKLKKSDLVSKSVSLNDILAAESKQREEIASVQRPLLPDTSERLSLNKGLKLKPRKSKKLNIPETILPRSSLLKFRKRFQIKSPLKHRSLKFIEKPRHKRRYQSIKREIYRNDKLNKKYKPLLRSLNELFDNMLPSNSGESNDSEWSPIKLRRNKSKDDNESSCTCKQKSRAANPKASKETTTPTTISTQESTVIEVTVTPTEIPSTTPDNAALSDISDLGSNSNISILLTRDTFGPGRDHSRLSEGSSSTNHTSTEGNISRNNGNSERDTAHGEDRSSSADYEETSNRDTRIYASGSGFENKRGFERRGLHADRDRTRSPVFEETQEIYENRKNKDSVRQLRGEIGDRDDTRSPVYREVQETNENVKTEDVRQSRGDHSKSEGETELEMGRDEAKSTTPIPQFVPGFRGFVPNGEIGQKSQFIPPKEIYEKSGIRISDDNSSDKRIPNGDGTYTTENKNAGEANARVISVKDLSNPIIMLQSPKHNSPYVTIFDGYSVARDINGSNKLAEQSIQFHS